MANDKQAKKKLDTFLYRKMKCSACKKSAMASTMDISASAPLACPHCGHVDD